MDALTHLIEAYVSVVNFPIADAMCIHGIKMVRDALPVAFADGNNIKAREDMLVASMMAGAAFTVNNLGLCHQMAHQLSAYCGLAHGLANAILLPHVMKFNLPANPKKYADVAEALGADIKGMPVEVAACKAVELVEKLCAELGIPRHLDDVGVDKSLVPAMAITALQDNVGNTNQGLPLLSNVNKYSTARSEDKEGNDYLKEYKLFIGGEWVPTVSGKVIDDLNPADGSVLRKYIPQVPMRLRPRFQQHMHPQYGLEHLQQTGR